MPFILEAVRLVREALAPEQAVIGFAGGPFTVAGYLIEGKPTREFKLTKACMYGQPEVWHALMQKLAAAFALYVDGWSGRAPTRSSSSTRGSGRFRSTTTGSSSRPTPRRCSTRWTCRRSISAPGRRTCSRDGGGRRRRHRRRLADSARRRLGGRRLRARGTGEPRARAPARALGARARRRRSDPRGGRRAAGPHLQPRPRGPAGNPTGRPRRGWSSSCTSARRRSPPEGRGRPDGVRQPVETRGRPPLPRGHPRWPAGLGRGGRGAGRAVPADRRALAARRRDRGPAGRAWSASSACLSSSA